METALDDGDISLALFKDCDAARKDLLRIAKLTKLMETIGVLNTVSVIIFGDNMSYVRQPEFVTRIIHRIHCISIVAPPHE